MNQIDRSAECCLRIPRCSGARVRTSSKYAGCAGRACSGAEVGLAAALPLALAGLLLPTPEAIASVAAREKAGVGGRVAAAPPLPSPAAQGPSVTRRRKVWRTPRAPAVGEEAGCGSTPARRPRPVVARSYTAQAEGEAARLDRLKEEREQGGSLGDTTHSQSAPLWCIPPDLLMFHVGLTEGETVGYSGPPLTRP